MEHQHVYPVNLENHNFKRIAMYFWIFFRGRFWIFFGVPGSMLSCFLSFSASLLFCFSAFPASLLFLLLCCSASLLFAFPAFPLLANPKSPTEPQEDKAEDAGDLEVTEPPEKKARKSMEEEMGRLMKRVREGFELTSSALDKVQQHLDISRQNSKDLTQLAQEVHYDKVGAKYTLAQMQSMLSCFQNVEWQLSSFSCFFCFFASLFSLLLFFCTSVPFYFYYSTFSFLLLYFLLLCFFASCLYCLFVFRFCLLNSVLFIPNETLERP